MRERAARHDAEASLPLDDLSALRDAGTLGVQDEDVHDLLVLLGSGNPALGRLVEAHVNALHLVRSYGTPAQAASCRADAAAGRLFGLWVTDAPGAVVRLRGGTLHGTKAPCSGVGAVATVLTTVETDAGSAMALIPADAPHTEPMPPIAGMRAARQGRAVFDGVPCPPGALVGSPGDYLREPELSCGAWRTSAITLGVLDSLVDALRDHLRARRHADAPLQQERFGRLLIAQGTARMWVDAACRAARHEMLPTTDRVMGVNLARVAVELACLDALPPCAALRRPGRVRSRPDGAHRPRPRNLPSPARSRRGADGGRRPRARHDAMTAGEAQAAMEALPFGQFDDLTGGGTAVVLAPHPDDESLGCGGFIAEACRRGQPPLVLVLTDGAGSHPGSRAFPRERLVPLREEEARMAVAELGLPPGRIVFLRQPDTAAPTSGPAFDRVIADIAGHCRGAGVLLAPWRHDPHCDHEAAHLIAAAVARRTAIRHLAYPVWGWMLPPGQVVDGPGPAGLRLDIAAHLPAKRRAIAAHRSQYAGLIEDDPGGFQLPPDLLAVFDRPCETFLTDP